MTAAITLAVVAVAGVAYAASEAEDAEDAQNAARKAQQRQEQLRQSRQNMAAMREAQRQRALAVQQGVVGGTSGSSSSMLGATRAGQQASSAIGFSNAMQEYSNAQFLHMQDAYSHMQNAASGQAVASVAGSIGGMGFGGSAAPTKDMAAVKNQQAAAAKAGK